jgi:predicted metalloprotease with PDZ domain
MAIKPAAYREVDYKVQPPVPELWFSEGLTIYYADLLLRRAGLPTSDSTRIHHLERLIARYAALPGQARFSAEQISRVAYNASPTALGDYSASSHLQGEIIGVLLDFLIRDATDGARSMDDVMRLLYERSRNGRFISRDVQKAVEDVCKCSASDIFDRYVFGANPVDFDRHLNLVGLRAEVTWASSMNDDGTRATDLRASAWLPDGEKNLRLRVMNPNSAWGRADLHTGDVIVTINGKPIATWPEFRTFVRAFAIGDSATFVVQRGGSTLTRRVVMAGFDRPVVRIVPVESPTTRQRHLLSLWTRGLPSASAPAPSQPGARQ